MLPTAKHLQLSHLLQIMSVVIKVQFIVYMFIRNPLVVFQPLSVHVHVLSMQTHTHPGEKVHMILRLYV